MKLKTGTHHRRSLRLQGYDYSRAGAYFVTICTQNHECKFGKIADGRIQLNDAGKMVQAVWDEIPTHYNGIEIDEFVIMPNHFHGIVIIVNGFLPCYSDSEHLFDSLNPNKLSLSEVVHRFKTMTTKRYTDGVRQNGWPSFPGRLWQRNYWERVVRNELELRQIREYIQNNPSQWEMDKLFVGAAPRGRPETAPRGRPEH